MSITAANTGVKLRSSNRARLRQLQLLVRRRRDSIHRAEMGRLIGLALVARVSRGLWRKLDLLLDQRAPTVVTDRIAGRQTAH